MAHQGDFSQLARCGIPLAPLLLARPVTRLVNHPMVSILSPDVVARVTVEMRLAVPVAEMYKSYLQRHPGWLSTSPIKTPGSSSLHNDNIIATTESAPVDNESRLFNELEITVVRCTSLPMATDHTPPHAYVHFQLLGNPDTFTNPIQSRNGQPFEFSEQFVFPMVTYDKQLRLMARSPLLFTVLDLKAEEQDIQEESGLIGTVPLSLKALIEGKTMDGSYQIISPSGTAAGKLQVMIPFQYIPPLDISINPYTQTYSNGDTPVESTFRIRIYIHSLISASLMHVRPGVCSGYCRYYCNGVNLCDENMRQVHVTLQLVTWIPYPMRFRKTALSTIKIFVNTWSPQSIFKGLWHLRRTRYCKKDIR